VRAQILVVCQANVCRSPAMAALLRGALPEVDIMSRGLSADTGMPACAATERYLTDRGIPLINHESARLTTEHIRRSTIILAATRWQRAAVVEMWPSARIRTHTLAAAARGASWLAHRNLGPRTADQSEKVLWLTEQLYVQRRDLPRCERIDDDDLIDPHGEGKHSVLVPRLFHLATTLSRALVSI